MINKGLKKIWNLKPIQNNKNKYFNYKEESILNKEVLINEKTRRIIEFLGFYDKKTSGTDIENIIKTYKYVIQNINKDLAYKEHANHLDPKTNYYDTLLLALENNPGLPTTNCVLLQHLLRGINVDSYLVLCKSNRSGTPHIANLVKIKKEYYYFDPTLEKTITDENDSSLLLCAALGKSDYEKLYTPMQVIRRPEKKSKDSFPKNIAEESIAKVIVNAISLKIPNNLKIKPERDTEREGLEL